MGDTQRRQTQKNDAPKPRSLAGQTARTVGLVGALLGGTAALVGLPGGLEARQRRQVPANVQIEQQAVQQAVQQKVPLNVLRQGGINRRGFDNRNLGNQLGNEFGNEFGNVGGAVATGGASHARWDGHLTAPSVKTAITDAIAFLRSRIGPTGQLIATYDAVGETSLAALAMLAAGLHPTADTDLARALTWLLAAPSDNTYARAIRATVWEYALRKVPQVSAWAEALDADRAWLEKARNSEGWRYNQSSSDWDNSCTQYGVLGLWAAKRAGHTIPEQIWRDLTTHFLKVQNADGGWGYTGSGSSANMVTAGLASLFVIFDQLHGGAVYRQGQAAPYAEGEAAAVLAGIDRGVAWLASNGGANEDPYYLYGIERVGVASGRTRIGGRDWFVEGARQLLAHQGPDGGFQMTRGITASTSLSALFLVYGGAPVAFAKYAWDAEPGHWNLHPRDLANLSAALWGAFEQPLNWQQVAADVAVEDIEAPVLLLSGAHAAKFSNGQRALFRTYVARGGVLLGEALDGAPAFTTAMETLAHDLFPKHTLHDLPADHALYTALRQDWRDAPPKVRGVEVDGRLVMVLGAGQLSAAWQRDDREHDAFRLGTNLLYLAAGRALPPHRFERTLGPDAPVADGTPPPAKVPERAVVTLAWGLTPEFVAGAWDLAAPFIAHDLGTHGEGEAKVRPTVQVFAGSALNDPSEGVQARLRGAALIHLTGRGAFAPGAEGTARIVDAVRGGATLVVDAWEGDAAFAASAQAWSVATFGALTPIADTEAVAQGRFDGGVDLTRHLRVNRAARQWARSDATESGGTGLGAYMRQARSGRGRVLYTALDLSSALGGRTAASGPGFQPQTSRAVFANLLASYAAP